MAVKSGDQSWEAPSTLAQLLDLLKGSKDAPDQAPMRLVAGNTGAGVYKNWPSAGDRLIDVTRVKELQVLQRTQVCMGATCIPCFEKPLAA